MLDSGWIKLHRSFINWEWFGDANMVATFIHCLFEANWEDKKWHGAVIERGSFITSYPHLSKNIGISTQQLRTCLQRLKSTGEITVKTTNKYSLISINNYNKYQQSTSHTTVQQQASNSPATTTKEYKEIKNNTYSSLSSITDADLQEISKEYDVTITFVRSKFEDLKNYCGSKNKRYANYKLTLKNWVKRDYEKNGGKLKPLPDEIARKRRELSEQFGVYAK